MLIRQEQTWPYLGQPMNLIAWGRRERTVTLFFPKASTLFVHRNLTPELAPGCVPLRLYLLGGFCTNPPSSLACTQHGRSFNNLWRKSVPIANVSGSEQLLYTPVSSNRRAGLAFLLSWSRACDLHELYEDDKYISTAKITTACCMK